MEAHESLERFEKAHGHGHGDGHEDSLARLAALTVAVVAAFLAIATFLGNESVKEAIQGETKVAEQSTHLDVFESQDTQIQIADVLVTVFSAARDQGLAATAKAVEKEITKQSKGIADERKRLQESLSEHRGEVTDANDKHLRYELAEVLLQIAIVLASVAIIARRRLLLYGGHLLAIAGVVILVLGYVR
jgi:NTP pyrophosphatase (non-canonical NTP hydrolase)